MSKCNNDLILAGSYASQLMGVGTITLHRFNGDEVFNVEKAIIEHRKHVDGMFAVVFRADAGGTPIQTLPDTAPLHAKPFAEVTLHLPKIPALALTAGLTFTIPKGYDEHTQDYLSNFYYCEHEPMDEIEISILDRNGLGVRARISGTTIDVNYYDGSKPLTNVVVEACFSLTM
jgi:hypothetical protein